MFFFLLSILLILIVWLVVKAFRLLSTPAAVSDKAGADYVRKVTERADDKQRRVIKHFTEGSGMTVDEYTSLLYEKTDSFDSEDALKDLGLLRSDVMEADEVCFIGPVGGDNAWICSMEGHDTFSDGAFTRVFFGRERMFFHKTNFSMIHGETTVGMNELRYSDLIDITSREDAIECTKPDDGTRWSAKVINVIVTHRGGELVIPAGWTGGREESELSLKKVWRAKSER